jgi:hypothetical protein
MIHSVGLEYIEEQAHVTLVKDRATIIVQNLETGRRTFMSPGPQPHIEGIVVHPQDVSSLGHCTVSLLIGPSACYY